MLLHELLQRIDAHICLGRIIRHLASTQMLEQPSMGVFRLTPFTASLAEPAMASTVDMYLLQNAPGMINLPKYLANTNYQNPADAVNGNWTHLKGIPLWDYLKANPYDEQQFGLAMSALAANRLPLSELYPTKELVEHVDSQGVLLVDCGGSVGHDVEAFKRAHPHAPGKLVLQDRPEVIENIQELDASIERMPHDFLTPQPVKGAAAYYL